MRSLIPSTKGETLENKEKQEDNLSIVGSDINWSKVAPSLELHSLFSEDLEKQESIKLSVLVNNLESIDWCITNIWKDLTAFPEIINPFKDILNVAAEVYPGTSKPKQLVEKIEKLLKFQERLPLTLQQHKPLAIPSNTPKFEENFNPDKKSYDPDKTRSELNKMKAQLKKERKFTMKEIRKDTRFEARQGIEEKKKEYADYHSKMARIVNQISTEEGAEKNKYEREKKLRNTKR